MDTDLPRTPTLSVPISYHPMVLPDGSAIELALPTNSADPVVRAYADGNCLNQYLVDWLLRFTKPGDRVLDLGCHVGTLAVPAAALGRKVLAVDASPLHADCVRRSAARAGLADLHVERCAIDRDEGEVTFAENGLWGMVVAQSSGESAGVVRVPSRRADALARSLAWDHVDLVKIDIEGSELAAIESLGSLLAGERAPVIVYESNGMTFELFGYGIEDVRRRLEALAYVTCRVEGDRLIRCDPMQLQPEAWLDVVALPSAWQERYGGQIETWSDEEMVTRCLEWGSNGHRNVREYLHRALAMPCRYPSSDSRITALKERLAREFTS